MTGVCWPHLSDNSSLIDRGYAASWGAGRLTEQEWRLREGVNEGEGMWGGGGWVWGRGDAQGISGQLAARGKKHCHFPCSPCLAGPDSNPFEGLPSANRVLKPNQTGWKEKARRSGPARLPLVWAIHLRLTRSGILNKPCTSWTAEKPHSGTWRQTCLYPL